MQLTNLKNFDVWCWTDTNSFVKYVFYVVQWMNVFMYKDLTDDKILEIRMEIFQSQSMNSILFRNCLYKEICAIIIISSKGYIKVFAHIIGLIYIKLHQVRVSCLSFRYPLMDGFELWPSEHTETTNWNANSWGSPKLKNYLGVSAFLSRV